MFSQHRMRRPRRPTPAEGGNAPHEGGRGRPKRGAWGGAQAAAEQGAARGGVPENQTHQEQGAAASLGWGWRWGLGPPGFPEFLCLL